MAETPASTGLTPQVWDDNFFAEYVRDNRFARYMGTDMNKIIQVKRDLTVKKGNKITFASVRRLKDQGVSGNQVLEGNEEELDSRALVVTVDYIRHGVLVTDKDEQLSAIGLRDAAKPALKVWEMEKMRNDILTAFGSIDGKAYSVASEAEKDAWLANNSDRVLFGALRSNISANDHSVALATLDTTADTMRTSIISLAARMAKTADPHLRPIQVNGDEEWWVLFTGPRAFRDLKTDATMIQANQYARDRGKDNPLFTGNDLVWDNVIIREIPEIAALPLVGSGGTTDVEPAYLVGAQAIGVGWAETVTTTTNIKDYGFRRGVGIQECRGIEKLRFGTGSTDGANSKQAGQITVYVAAAADA